MRVQIRGREFLANYPRSHPSETFSTPAEHSKIECTQSTRHRLPNHAANRPPPPFANPFITAMLAHRSQPYLTPLHFFCFPAKQLTFKCSGSSQPLPSTSQEAHVDPHTGVHLQEITATVSKDLVYSYFGKGPFKCECHAWSPRGKAKSQPATVEVACKCSALGRILCICVCLFYCRKSTSTLFHLTRTLSPSSIPPGE